MQINDKIYIAGATGLVGSAITHKLYETGYSNIITNRIELTNYDTVLNFFITNKFDYIFLCAAKVGGILANNTYPVDFLETNLRIQLNVIKAAHEINVKKLLFLGSSCIYPNNFLNPISEKDLLNGPLESTNSAYAIAKITGIELIKAYNKQYGLNGICPMPCNLFGPGDNFDLNSSHVLPALIKKFHEAKINNSPSVTCWGDGSPKREFLYSEDLAEACIFLMQNYNSTEIINVGTGEDISIKELVNLIKNIVRYSGEIIWDISKPNGTMRKVLNCSKINNLGWKYKTSLKEGISKVYDWYINSQKSL